MHFYLVLRETEKNIETFTSLWYLNGNITLSQRTFGGKMTLNQLRYFCMASRCHSITKAAEELYVTQPTVSVAIRDLEIEFGVSLFSRKGNQLILTREGEEFYQKANYILQYCNELQADYSNLSRVRPPIRIGIPPMLSTVFFPELLLAFSEEHPEIAVSLEEYGSVRACNLVQDDTLDLALVNMEQYNIDKFHHAVLADDQVVFCVAKNHPWQAEKWFPFRIWQNSP